MSRLLLFPLLAAWLLVLAAGAGFLIRYESTPGVGAAPPGRWPPGSRIAPVEEQATLVMLAHPRCPCTRASVEQLAHIMAQNHAKVRAFVVFFAPQNAASNWMDTGSCNRASAIKGVTVLRDPGGTEAARFHAATSGETLLYDASGRLLFQGGITGGRGRYGANVGSAALLSLLASGKAKPAKAQRTPVFGCALCAPLQ